jgi:hypothetical protein
VCGMMGADRVGRSGAVPLLCAQHLRLRVQLGLRRVRAAGPRQRPGVAAAASFLAAVLAEIYLCDACSCHEILSRNGRGQNILLPKVVESLVRTVVGQVSPFLLRIGSRCLGHCVHGAPIAALT